MFTPRNKHNPAAIHWRWQSPQHNHNLEEELLLLEKIYMEEAKHEKQKVPEHCPKHCHINKHNIVTTHQGANQLQPT